MYKRQEPLYSGQPCVRPTTAGAGGPSGQTPAGCLAGDGRKQPSPTQPRQERRVFEPCPGNVGSVCLPHTKVVWGECDRISLNKIQEGSSPILHEPGQRRGTKSVREFSLLNAVCSDAPTAGAKHSNQNSGQKVSGGSVTVCYRPPRRADESCSAGPEGRNRFPTHPHLT